MASNILKEPHSDGKIEISPEVKASADKAVKSNDNNRLINLFLEVLKKSYQSKGSEVIQFEAVLKLLGISDLNANARFKLLKSLRSNVKVHYDETTQECSFKPTLDIRNTKDLKKLLQSNEELGKGGVLYSQVREAIPNYEGALLKLKDDLIEIPLREKGEKVLFHKIKDIELTIDEDFKTLWRSVGVERLGENSIENELDITGVSRVKEDEAASSSLAQKRKLQSAGKTNKRIKRKKGHIANSHLDKGYLKDYV